MNKTSGIQIFNPWGQGAGLSAECKHGRSFNIKIEHKK